MSRALPRVIEQLTAAGLLSEFTDLCVVETDNGGTAVRGTMRLDVVARLRADRERFACGFLHGLHADVGEHRVDFRSYNGTFGSGSLQIVIDERTGNAYADVDGHNPYQDVVRFLGHAFGEVIPHWWRKLRRKRKDG